MIKRLLLLLCLIGMAGSAAWANIDSGTFKNGGTWKITDEGELYIDATTVPDYVVMAPWYDYRSQITMLRFSSKIKTIGKLAFYGMFTRERLDHDDGTWEYVEIGLRHVVFDNKSSKDVTIKERAFERCFCLASFDFSYVSNIGEKAFNSCYHLSHITLPAVTSIGDNAFSGTGLFTNGNNPSIYISASTKPTIGSLSYGIAYDAARFATIVVPPTMYSQYPSQIWDETDHRHPKGRIYPGYYARTVNGDHSNNGYGASTGVATETWWYVDGTHLYVNYEYGIPDFASPSDAPWYEYRNQIKDVTLYMDRLYAVVGKNAFAGFTKLTDINRSNKILEIHEGAFKGCTALGENKIDLSSVKSVGKEAFADCSAMTTLALPAVVTIDEKAFYNCTKLNNITLSTFVESIGSKAFANTLKGLRDFWDDHIYVFSEVPTTANDAFDGCNFSKSWLNLSVELARSYESHPAWKQFPMSKDVELPVHGLIVNGSGSWELNRNGELCIHGNTPNYESVREQPWYDYRELIQKIIIDDGWGIIGDYSFAFDDPAYCHVTDYKLPVELKKIGKHAFENNYLLKEVSIENMEEVDDYAFAGCTLLKSAYFGENSAKFGKHVFDGCENFDEMTLTAATPPEVTAETFQGMGSSSGSQGTRRRAAGTGQKSVTLDVPDEYLTKYLANPYWRLFSFYAGEYGRIVNSGNFGDGLWILYDNGTMVVSADKGPGNTYAEGSAQALGFGSSSDSNSPINLTKRVEFMGNITHLGWGFQNFPNLESVQLCPSITRLDDTFEGCPKLTGINLENVDTIGDWTFARSGVKDISLPRVSYIGRGAFYKCQQLQTVSLGSTCEIREQAFFYCDKMTDINLADARLDGASQCFSSCYKLKNVIFSGTNLPSQIFSNCFDLASIDLGSRVDSISFDAFYGCNALNTVYCANPTPPAMPWGKRKVGDEYYDAQAFFGRNLSNIHLYLPASLVLPYRKADVWKGMTIETDLRYTEDLLPTGGAVGDKGTWHIDADGTLTLDFEGYAWSNDLGGVKWHDLLAPWVPFLTRVVVSDRVNWVPTDMTGEHNPEWSAAVTSVELGSHVTEVNSGSLNYSGLRDVYCYAESCPIVRETGFDWEALAANNATLHVVTSEGVLGRYQNSRMWSRFPNIVANLPSRLPAGVFHTTTAEGLELWFRVTDEAARTCETFVNDMAGCAVENNPYTQYERLTIPATAQYNGTAYTVTAIGDNSFYGCTNFATFILPETIERIGVNAFKYCFSVHEFTLPASVKYIGEYAFEMWVNIERLTVNGQVPPAVDDNFINTYWDPDLRPKPVLLVPEGCRDAWNVAPWNEWFTVYDPYNKSMLTYKVKPGTEFYDYYKNDEDYMCIEGLKALDIIRFENEMIGRVWDPVACYWEEIWGDVYYNKAGKKLFYIDDESCIQIFEGVGPADNIYYEFKADDYETMMYTTGRNVDLYKGAAIIFPESNVQTDIYFTATNADGIDISYRVLDLSKKTCEVKADPNGYGSNAVSSDVSDVKVPFEAGGYVVTGIAADAFNSMSGLQVVTLPTSIRNIGANAFGYCENVVAVYMECAAPPMLLDEDGFLTVENNMAFENIGVPAGTEMNGAMLYVPYGSEEAYDVYPWNYWFGSSIQTDPDGIKSLTPALSKGEGAWYSLDGRKLGSKPTKAGLYIVNGKKIVIK